MSPHCFLGVTVMFALKNHVFSFFSCLIIQLRESKNKTFATVVSTRLNLQSFGIPSEHSLKYITTLSKISLCEHKHISQPNAVVDFFNYGKALLPCRTNLQKAYVVSYNQGGGVILCHVLTRAFHVHLCSLGACVICPVNKLMKKSSIT